MRLVKYFLYLFVLIPYPAVLYASGYPLTFADSSGQTITLNEKPLRVVSLVPSVTEILDGIGVAELLVGVTYHSTLLSVTGEKGIIGGFAHPSIEKIKPLQPDLIFYSSLQKDIVTHFGGEVALVNLQAHSIEESFVHIRQLGDIFDASEQAEIKIAEQTRLLDVIQKKTSLIDDKKKLRVMRLMGTKDNTSIMAPGDDSFQNEYILRAGGIPPAFGKNGSIVPITREEWQHFNPEVVYSCGDTSELIQFLQKPGWNDVDAVKNNKILTFPCDLTCRLSVNQGEFVALLSARLYNQEFSDPGQHVLSEGRVGERFVDIDLDYVSRAKIVESNIRDFRNKTLLVEFTRPMKILSTLAGERTGIRAVANHFFPPPSWRLDHHNGLANLEEYTLQALGLPKNSSAFLYTGADMDNLSIVKKTYRHLDVYALVTAGVKSNALRMATDTGKFYPEELFSDTAIQQTNENPGTINIILLTNVSLTPRAMTKAMVNITEAKSAVLQDLDVRSTPTPLTNQATGTGTDNILVVQGSGVSIDRTGGHTKIGQIIAEAVYEAVLKAIQQQNGLSLQRSVFHRLQERGINLYSVTHNDRQLHQELEALLLTPKYGNFLSMALALSDRNEKKLFSDSSSYKQWCHAIASEIAGRQVSELTLLPVNNVPDFIHYSLAALITGLQEKRQK